MQGLLDTAEREFGVGGWAPSASSANGASRAPRKQSSASRGGITSGVAPQKYRGLAVYAERSRGSRLGPADNGAMATSPGSSSSRQLFGNASDLEEENASFLRRRGHGSNNQHASLGNGSRATATPAVGINTGAADANRAAEIQRQQQSRKRQRVRCELDTNGSRAGPSSPDRPEAGVDFNAGGQGGASPLNGEDSNAVNRGLEERNGASNAAAAAAAGTYHISCISRFASAVPLVTNA